MSYRRNESQLFCPLSIILAWRPLAYAKTTDLKMISQRQL